MSDVSCWIGGGNQWCSAIQSVAELQRRCARPLRHRSVLPLDQPALPVWPLTPHLPLCAHWWHFNHKVAAFQELKTTLTMFPNSFCGIKARVRLVTCLTWPLTWHLALCKGGRCAGVNGGYMWGEEGGCMVSEGCDPGAVCHREQHVWLTRRSRYVLTLARECSHTFTEATHSAPYTCIMPHKRFCNWVEHTGQKHSFLRAPEMKYLFCWYEKSVIISYVF